MKQKLNKMIGSTREVCYEMNRNDIKEIIEYSKQTNFSVIMRTTIIKAEDRITKYVEVLFDTKDKDERIELCETFNLRKTSHINNSERILYSFLFPVEDEEAKKMEDIEPRLHENHENNVNDVASEMPF